MGFRNTGPAYNESHLYFQLDTVFVSEKLCMSLVVNFHLIIKFFFQPVFLNRTLSYMKQRMSRTHKHRKGFKVDCLLDRINMKNREMQPGNLEGYMTLTFLGFYDKKGNIYFSILRCL